MAELNKSGNKRGVKSTNKQNFANDKKLASEAGKKAKSKQAVTQAITKSSAIAKGRAKRITPEIQDEIREKLTKVDTKGHTWISDFVDNFLKEARKDPNSRAGMLMASTLFSEKLLSQLDEEVNKQMNRDISFADYNIRKTLYDKQQNVYDNNQDSMILVINSRRTGKTELAGRLLAKRILRPDQHVVYINRSFDAAARQIQKPVETALEAGSVHYSGTIGGGRLDFDNGSWLLVIGNNNAADVNKLRGEKIALCIIDECGHQRHLRELVQDVISPAMIDYADSQIIFIGTPPRTKVHYIHDLWRNSKAKKYHWTFMDNPFLPNRENVIENACGMFGVSPDSNFIKREFYGDMDAYDQEALYIKTFEKNEAPKDKLYHYAYVGVDWGYEDKAAVVGMVADKNSKTMYIVKDWSEAKKGITEISSKIQEMVKYLKENYKLDRDPMVICDTNEKSAAQDLYTTYHIPNICLAYKYDKDYALDQLSDWFSASTVIVSHCAEATIQDAENMLWKRDEDTDKIIHELDEEAYHGNAMMAVLYVSRQFAYDIMGLVAENKPAKEITNAMQLLENAGENIGLGRDIGVI